MRFANDETKRLIGEILKAHEIARDLGADAGAVLLALEIAMIAAERAPRAPDDGRPA